MKKIIFLLFALVPVVSRAQNYDYTLTVKLKVLPAAARAYLVTSFGWTNQQVVDSASVAGGKFLFRGTAEKPRRVQLVVDRNGQGLNSLGLKAADADVLVIYLEPGAIVVRGGDSVRHAVITGSLLNAEYSRYSAAVLSRGEKALEAVNAAYKAAPAGERNDKTFTEGLMAQVKKAMQQRDSLKYVYIRQHPESYLSLEALEEIAGRDIDVNAIGPVFESLSPVLKGSRAGKDFANRLYDHGPLSIGALAPDFMENDANDRPVRLSDLKGKYVLLDFWASWCGPCRAENPNVVKAFDKYKDRNFTVLGVSLDRPGQKEAWLAAIQKDSLSWTQVSDLQFWNSAAARTYGITAIPQNFLIDPSGKIIAKNLRGDALEKKLEEIF